MKNLKQLIIMRHAKAEDFINQTADFERNLVEKGKNQVLEVCEIFKKENIVLPEIIFTSSANRTLQTAEIFAKNLKIPKEKIILKESLYGTNLQNYLNILKFSENENIMIVGHNPFIKELSNYFLSEKIEHFKKSQVLILRFEDGKVVDEKFLN